MNDGYAICLNKWALDKDIKNELGLLLIISSLCAEKGHCWATNEYLAELFNESETSISKKISKLQQKGYIEIEYKKRGFEVQQRTIRLSKMTMVDCQNYQRSVVENGNPSVVKNDKEKNTSRILQYEKYEEIYKEVIDYLNMKIGSNYKHTTKSTQTKINARLNEGYNLDDFIAVIDKKSKEWLGTSMEQYLRPETLFGTKFESYLNQKEVKKELSNSDKQWEILKGVYDGTITIN